MLPLWSNSILLRVIKYFNVGISIAHLPMRPNENWEIIFGRYFSPPQRNNIVHNYTDYNEHNAADYKPLLYFRECSIPP